MVVMTDEARAMDCGSIAANLKRIAGELGCALTGMDRGTAYAYVEGARDDLRRLAAMECRSVAPTNLEISAIGASMHCLVRSGKISEDVHDAVMRWLVASRDTEQESKDRGGER